MSPRSIGPWASARGASSSQAFCRHPERGFPVVLPGCEGHFLQYGLLRPLHSRFSFGKVIAVLSMVRAAATKKTYRVRHSIGDTRRQQKCFCSDERQHKEGQKKTAANLVTPSMHWPFECNWPQILAAGQ